MKMYERIWRQDIVIFNVHDFWKTPEGLRCYCENPHCEAIGKHPCISNWQNSPLWPEEDMNDLFLKYKVLDHAYGVLLPSKNLLVVDVDARNGGVEGFQKLCEDIPEVSGSGMIVNTGSGGGSKHLYFYLPEKMALVQGLPEYKGVDFKSTGFVIGPGSQHASGGRYECVYGGPEEIDMAPQGLIDKLRKPDRIRVEYKGSFADVSNNDIAEMLSFVVNDDLDYETWIRIGMCIHHATGGDGYDLWHRWSSTSGKHDDKAMQMKWHSFGKSANPATLGTLIFLAEKGGWVKSATFDQAGQFEVPDYNQAQPDGLPFEIDTVDIYSPPGFVGVVAQWIENQSRRPRRLISVAGALTAIGNIAGLRYTDDKDRVTTNLFSFCVAGSRTGKESIESAVKEIHRVCELGSATHGSIKSEQEIGRNLTQHQTAFYIVDEIGELLSKIQNARLKGGAPYLDGIIGMLMSAYSKADGWMLLTGDAKREVQKIFATEISQLMKKKEANEATPFDLKRLASVEAASSSIDNGLEKPFLSLMGFTVPITFDTLVDHRSATNGFIGRSLIFREIDTAPRTKKKWHKQPMPEMLKNALYGLAYDGSFTMEKPARIEYYGERRRIPTEDDACSMLDAALEWFEDRAVEHRDVSGMESLYLGAYELVSKVSLILAIPEGLRTTEHVRWAFALVKKDVERKALLVEANEREKDDPSRSLRAKIIGLLEGDEFRNVAHLVVNIRKRKRTDIEKEVAYLVEKGLLSVREEIHRGNGKKFKTYRISEGNNPVIH